MSSVPVALAGARIVTVVTSDCFGARSEAAGVTRARTRWWSASTWASSACWLAESSPAPRWSRALG